jgi:hypothetical protein
MFSTTRGSSITAMTRIGLWQTGQRSGSTCQTRRIRPRRFFDGSLRSGCGRRDGHAGWGGFTHEINLRRGQAVGLVDEVTKRALQFQGFGGADLGGCAEKLKLGKQSTLRSLVHPPQYRYGGRESGNQKVEGAAVSGCFLPSPFFCSLRPCFLTPLVSAFRPPVSAFSFSAFQLFRFLLRPHVLESSSVRVKSLLLGFAIPYPTRSQSSNVRRVCCWRDMISIRRRTKWVKPCVGGLSPVIGPTYGLARLRPVYPSPFTLPARLVRWSVAQARPGPPSCAWR